MTCSIDEGPWLFRNYDTRDDVTPYRFTFVRWVSLGDRHDIAAVEVLDPWTSYLGIQVPRAFFAARHAGVDLRALVHEDIPAHVHLLTVEPDFVDAEALQNGMFQRAAWATIEPADWTADPPPDFQVFQTRPI